MWLPRLRILSSADWIEHFYINWTKLNVLLHLKSPLKADPRIPLHSYGTVDGSSHGRNEITRQGINRTNQQSINTLARRARDSLAIRARKEQSRSSRSVAVLFDYPKWAPKIPMQGMGHWFLRWWRHRANTSSSPGPVPPASVSFFGGLKPRVVPRGSWMPDDYIDRRV